MKKRGIISTFLVSFFAFSSIALADAVPGDQIVTFGENLTESQKTQLLSEMGANQNATIITVSNKEEHDYLGNYISQAKIGTRAISSSRITIGESNSGLSIESHNINGITDDMYKNALVTAGVKDADIYITAPFEVSGTAALTGLLKAYETEADVKIPEEVKQAANEEMVTTEKLGNSIGDQKATDLMSLVKAKIAEEKPQTKEDTQKIIEESADQLNIMLTADEKQGLVDFFDKLKDMNIDWNAAKESLAQGKEKLMEFLNDPQTQSWIAKIGDFFKNMIDVVVSWFQTDNTTN